MKSELVIKQNSEKWIFKCQIVEIEYADNGHAELLK